MLKRQEILPIIIGASLVTCIAICSFEYGNYVERKKCEVDFTKQAKELHGEIAHLQLTIHDQKVAIDDLEDMLKYSKK